MSPKDVSTFQISLNRDLMSVSSPQSESAWWREEVPQGVWHGEPGHVVHRLPLEKGLPEIHRLSILQLHHGATRRQALLPSRPEKTGRGIVLHAFGFLQLKIATVCQAPALTLWMPLPLSSTEPFQPCKEPKDSAVNFENAVQDSHYCLAIPVTPRVWETTVQLNHVKKNFLKVSSVFLSWVQCCIFLCFVKLWFLNGKSKKGSSYKGQKSCLFLFLCVLWKKNIFFYPKEEWASWSSCSFWT